MCIVSDKIKFCTCTSENYDQLQHYWILYRFNKDLDFSCIGTAVMPTSMRDHNFQQNQLSLLARLKDGDAFDLTLNFQEKDSLEIVINNKAKEFDNRFTYNFQYKKGKWHAIEEDPFYYMNHFDEKEFGKIKSALKRKK